MGILDTIGGAAAGSLGLGKQFNSFMHPEEGYKNAEDELRRSQDEERRAWLEAHGILQPYNQAGMNQLPQLQGAETALLNPQQLEAQWASGYQESPYAHQVTQQATSAGLDSASQQGLLGSSAALSNVTNTAANISNADRQQYMNDLIQKYLAGIGVGQNIFGTGANAGNALATGRLQTGQNIATTGNDIAAARFGRTNAPGEMFGKLLKLGADAGTAYATGGA